MFSLINRTLFKNLMKMSTNYQSKYCLKMETKHRQDDPAHLVWVDCEMTGLDLEKDKLLEIAVIITDNELNEMDRLGPLVMKCDLECLDSMNEWCKANHAKTGLTAKCIESELTYEMADHLISDKLNQHSIQGAVLAGNSIAVDSLFIRKYLHKTADLLHYRLLDVSSIKLIKERWFPEVPNFVKTNKHEALSDILESLNELKYYKKNLFK